MTAEEARTATKLSNAKPDMMLLYAAIKARAEAGHNSLGLSSYDFSHAHQKQAEADGYNFCRTSGGNQYLLW